MKLDTSNLYHSTHVNLFRVYDLRGMRGGLSGSVAATVELSLEKGKKHQWSHYQECNDYRTDIGKGANLP